MIDHASELRRAAKEIRAEDHNGWGNTCEDAADYIDTLREAAGIVECKACNMPLSWELWPIMADCPACSRARALLTPPVPPQSGLATARG